MMQKLFRSLLTSVMVSLALFGINAPGIVESQSNTLGVIFAYLRNRSSTQAVGVVFFDFADAFGTVDRTKLLLKLCQDLGISGSLCYTCLISCQADMHVYR